MQTRLDMAIAFRPHEPADDDYIRALSAGAFVEYARSGARAVQVLMLDPWAHTEMALVDDEPVGFCVVTFAQSSSASVGDPPVGAPRNTRVAHLSAIATDPMMLRQGIARRLLGRAEAIARERGAVCLSLTTGVGNAPARALFTASGYLALAGVADFYRRGVDGVFMHKSL